MCVCVCVLQHGECISTALRRGPMKIDCNGRKRCMCCCVRFSTWLYYIHYNIVNIQNHILILFRMLDCYCKMRLAVHTSHKYSAGAAFNYCAGSKEYKHCLESQFKDGTSSIVLSLTHHFITIQMAHCLIYVCFTECGKEHHQREATEQSIDEEWRHPLFNSDIGMCVCVGTTSQVFLYVIGRHICTDTCRFTGLG